MLCFVVHWMSTTRPGYMDGIWDTDSFSFLFHWSGGIMSVSPGHSRHQGSWQRDFRSTELPVKFQEMHLVSSLIPHDLLKLFILLVLYSYICFFDINYESMTLGVFTLTPKPDWRRPTAECCRKIPVHTVCHCCYYTNIVLTAHMTTHVWVTQHISGRIFGWGIDRTVALLQCGCPWKQMAGAQCWVLVNSIYIADDESNWSRLCGFGWQEHTLTCFTTSSVLFWPQRESNAGVLSGCQTGHEITFKCIDLWGRLEETIIQSASSLITKNVWKNSNPVNRTQCI